MSDTITFYGYDRCSTCRKAKKWLNDHGIAFKDVPIVEQPPSRAELKEIWKKSGLELKKLFNTSGKKYRELNLKDKLKEMTEEEQLDMLASDGMLLKRPIVVADDRVTIGFKEADFEKNWLK
ncbi:MAG: arsenate reductase family protein [Bacillaceae bacterium]|nr:arsenate reductase family protein [Bacillaceae bacterium]